MGSAITSGRPSRVRGSVQRGNSEAHRGLNAIGNGASHFKEIMGEASRHRGRLKIHSWQTTTRARPPAKLGSLKNKLPKCCAQKYDPKSPEKNFFVYRWAPVCPNFPRSRNLNFKNQQFFRGTPKEKPQVSEGERWRRPTPRSSEPPAGGDDEPRFKARGIRRIKNTKCVGVPTNYIALKKRIEIMG